MQLARGMGALVMMRDDPSDAAIPEAFEPSQYSAKSLLKARTERDTLRAMTTAEANSAAQAEVKEYDRSESAYRAEKVVARQRYQAMLDKVLAWEGAPEGIKEFGLEQLRRGMEFDCPAETKFYRERPTEIGEEWRRAKLEKLAKDILYHAAEQAKEDARTEERNSWIAQLRRSLAQGDAPNGQ
jgi:hypothetical protein